MSEENQQSLLFFTILALHYSQVNFKTLLEKFFKKFLVEYLKISDADFINRL